MTAHIGRAHFGDQQGRHQLIGSEGINQALLGDVRWHTDVPPSAPSRWDAFFAGYPIGGYYIVQFTEPDDTARRSGMVATRLAAIDQSDVGEVSLRTLRQHAAQDRPTQDRGSECRARGLGAVIDLLAESRPAFWVGEPISFAQLVDELWDNLTPADRRRLVFGQLFSPSSIPYPIAHNAHQVYLVPASLRARFDANSLVDSSAPPADGEISRAILSGRMDLTEQLGIASPSLREWRQLATAERFLGEIAEGHDVDKIRATAHLISTLAPSPERGAELKTRVSAALMETAADAPFSHIRGFRTLRWEDYPDATAHELTERWVTAVVDHPARIDDLEAAFSEVQMNSADPVNQKLAAALADRISARGSLITDYLVAAVRGDRRRVFAQLARHANPSVVDPPLSSIDGLDQVDWVHVEAAQANLPFTHSVCCPTIDPTASFRTHLSIKGRTPESCRMLAARCDAGGLVSAALEIGAAELVELAAVAAERDPNALMPPQPTEAVWRAIWAGAVERGADAWVWLSPPEAAAPLIHAAIDGDPNVEPLIAALAASDLVTLTTFPRRREAWTSLKEPYRSVLLRRTAKALVLQEKATTDLESEMCAAAVSEEVLGSVSVIDVKRAIDALRSLSAYATPESAIAIAATANLGDHSASFGEVIAKHRWKRAARYVVEHATQRPDLEAAEAACRQLLSAWELLELKWLRTGRMPSAPELSAGLLDLVCSLYPEGPSGHKVWARSGGNEADIHRSETGRDAWRHALEMIVSGASGTPTLGSLVDEMRTDFPRNTNLERIWRAV